MTDQPEPRLPVVVDGEVAGVRPGPPSPLDADPDGTMPTVLRPTHPAARRRPPRRSLQHILSLRRRAIAAQVDIFEVYDAEVVAGIMHETPAFGRAHETFYAVWARLPLLARIGVWRAAVRRHYGAAR